VQEGEREVELLACPAGELLHAVAGVLGELQLVEQTIARGRRAVAVQSVGLGEQLEVLVDGELVPQQRILRAVAQPRGPLHRALVACEQPDDDLHQRALARPVLADEPDELARFDGQAGAAQDIHAPAAPRRASAKGLVDVDDPQDGRCVRCRPRQGESRGAGHAG